MPDKIIVKISKEVTDEIQKDIIQSLAELSYEVEINKKESTGPWMVWEYLIPSALTFIVSSYFAGFFKEFGALTTRGLIQTIKKSYSKLNEADPRIISKYHAELFSKELDKLHTEDEKMQFSKTHKYGKPANLISFENKSNNHSFTARYVFPSGLNEKNIEHALSTLPTYSTGAENYLIAKQNIFNENELLRKDNPSKFNEILSQNGYNNQTTTVFYYSIEDQNWINTEIHLTKSLNCNLKRHD